MSLPLEFSKVSMLESGYDPPPARKVAPDRLDAPLPDEGAGVCGCDAEADDGAALRFFVGCAGAWGWVLGPPAGVDDEAPVSLTPFGDAFALPSSLRAGLFAVPFARGGSCEAVAAVAAAADAVVLEVVEAAAAAG